jgi:hypothetical protein
VSSKKAVHVKKFDGGNRSPAEYHRQVVFAGKTCSTCGDPAAMSAKIMADDAEFRRRHPDAYMFLINKFGGDPSFKTKWGLMVTVEVIYACDRCKDSLRKYAATVQKDFMHVEFDEQGLDSSYPLVKGSA